MRSKATVVVVAVAAAMGCFSDVGTNGGETRPMAGNTGEHGSTGIDDDGVIPDAGTTEDADETGETGDEDDTGVADACGDGVVEGSEDCDDGNALDADGCTNDCRFSGSLVWAHVFDSDLAAEGTARSVAYAPEEDVYYAVGERLTDGFDDAWRAKVDPDGKVVWEATDGDPGTAEADSGVAISADGDLVVAGYVSNGPGLEDIRLRRISTSGAEVDAFVSADPGGQTDVAHDVAVGRDGRVLAVGQWRDVDDDRWIEALHSDFMPAWSDSQSETGQSVARAATWADELDNFYVAGFDGDTNVDAVGWVRGFGFGGAPGIQRYFPGDGATHLIGVAASLSGAYAVGWRLAVDGSYLAQLSSMTPVGDVGPAASEWEGIGGTGAWYFSIAVDSQSDLVVVGSSLGGSGDVEDTTAVVRKFSPQGEELWTTAVVPDGFEESRGFDVAIGPDNSIVVVGFARPPGEGDIPMIARLAP